MRIELMSEATEGVIPPGWEDTFFAPAPTRFPATFVRSIFVEKVGLP